MTGSNLLTLITFLPLTGALLVALFPRLPGAARAIALGVGIVELIITLAIAAAPPLHQPGVPAGYFLWTDLPWIERYGIRFLLGMDGISLAMCVLTAFITVVGIVVSWRGIKEKVSLHYVLLLVMETGILGVFLSLDLFLFYLFWEVMLIPMFILIGVWGHGRRIYSAVKFFIYTMAGSLLMLLAIIAVYLLHGSQTGQYTFALHELLGTQVPHSLALWLFGAFLLAFAIKFPLFPVHTWLPDAHTDAPTAGSVILAGLLLKTGAYGLLRFGFPLFPEAARTLTPVMIVLALVGIIYASWVAFAQEDLKRLVAYSSVGHMGFVALGIAAWTPVSLSGSVLQMVNHGVTTGALFAMVGMLDERAETREIAAFGGLWNKIPVYAFFFMLFSMASAGLPGLNNFAGEFLIVVGSFRAVPVAAAIAVVGIILPLVYTVRVVQEVLFVTERTPLTLADVTPRELLLLLVLAGIDIWLGLHPAPVLDLLHEPVRLLTLGGA